MTSENNEKQAAGVVDILQNDSILGPEWVSLYETDISFSTEHFETAMSNLIKQPNINSTVILRADILIENTYAYPSKQDGEGEKGEENEENESPVVNKFRSELADTKPDIPTSSTDEVILEKNLDDIDVRDIPLQPTHRPKVQIVRRIVPRNPFKDYIINQTCLITQLKSNESPSQDYDSTLIVYTPHIDNVEDCPFYLPSVQTVGILHQPGKLSVHYIPFKSSTVADFRSLSQENRDIRIAFRLLQTAKKHSTGVMDGYQKRVKHDLVVSKVAFQDRYISLKKKYSKILVDNWVESTDPGKHVFEDIAIAAFLIELWSKIYPTKEEFEFRDLGCGNGLLVHLLISEGYKGVGIDARARKSWKVYPENVQENLKEQVIIPSVLLRPHPSVKALAPTLTDNGRVFQVPVSNQGLLDSDPDVPVIAYYSSASLLKSNKVNVTEFPSNTFIIGNHSDELTCWIPLLGYPFLVIPCCSHALSGARVRFPTKRKTNQQNQANPKQGKVNSAYAGLVDHVEHLASEIGWKVEKEMLRIPSTRNAAIIGYQCDTSKHVTKSVYDLLVMEGGAEGWVENTMALTAKNPRNH
ncbi:hypothetical protein WICPIJ_006352 [Wickerhamomyces pijperi]|uniref:tRNA (uracil-O(2)-)-methyltransferase n=1 Tax=Wickerhamomyces pijperi TaxID=599730 RepID=A0A9P8Q4G2_WICPI|nr:hypothetical protein WICPIJ_006352 [Wickerhamomyces pijperi]